MTAGSRHYLVYITTSDKAEAHTIATALVERRLAACANVLSGISSYYRWEGKVLHEPEVPLFAKTTGERLDALIAAVRQLHSYDCPCVVAMPIERGNPQFLDWITGETAE